MNAASVGAQAQVVKRCRCGRSFTLREWRSLQYVGLQPGIAHVLELRLCGCGSSMGLREAIARRAA